MAINDIIFKLESLARGNDKYREFNSRIVNDLGGVKFIGVRTPDLRNLAHEIAKDDWQSFLRENNWKFYEMKQIAFLLPGYLELNFTDFFKLIDKLIPHASSWANCDALGLKRDFIRDNPDESWAKLAKYLDSKNGWAVRIGLNLAFANLLNDANIDRVFAEILKISARYRAKTAKGTIDYYVKMMLAWTLAEAAVNFREPVEEILVEVDPEVAKMTRQKMRDSYRIK